MSMKHLKTKEEIVNHLIPIFVSGISNKDYEKLIQGDKTVYDRVKKQMVKNVEKAKIVVIKTEDHGKVMIEELE